MRIAVVQHNVLEDLELGLDLIQSVVAGLPGPDIILLPELFATGYEFTDLASGLERSQRGFEFMQQLAREFEALVAGTLITQENGRVFNTFIMTGPERVLHRQHKTHLFKPMNEHEIFSPGHKIETFSDIMGAFICYELRFPEIARKLAAAGAKILFVPAEWPRPRQDIWRLLCAARAAENQVFLVAANRWGPAGQVFYGGNSAIYDPNGVALAWMGDGVGAIWADVELQDIERTRNAIGVWQDRREELY